ncbi:MAG: hypothetical protein FWE57_04080 [Chitinispirillia bacterium]|nr:hypothetical protein [Chitinispirillia bacterium]
MKKHRFSLLFCLIIVCAMSSVNAQQVRFSLDGGTSKPVGQNEDLLHWGFSVGGTVMFNIIDNLWIGGRIAYNRWGQDESEYIDRLTNLGLTDPDVHKGAGEALEVVPAVRLMTNYGIAPINFFLHGGAGLYVLNLEARVSGIRSGEDLNEAVTDILGDDVMRFGIQLGGGVLIGSPRFISVELFPIYHLIFNGQNQGRPFQYFSINLGVGLGI